MWVAWSRGSRVRSRSRSGGLSKGAQCSPETVVSVVPATTLPGDLREGCASSVPVDVLDALEDLGVGEGERTC